MHFPVLSISLLYCAIASAQSLLDGPAPVQQAQAMTKMRESVARQMASIRRQIPSVPDDGFFTVGWSTPDSPQADEQRWDAARKDDPDLCTKLSPDQASELIHHAAEQQGLRPALLHAVIQQESGYYPCAISPKGAMGLMQLMPATATDLGVADPLNPRENIEAGSRFLQQLLQRYGGNLVKALSAYNAGPARVDRIHGIPNIQETRQYVASIMRKLGLQAIESNE